MKKKEVFIIGLLSAIIVTFAVLSMIFENSIFSIIMLAGLSFENLFLWNINRLTLKNNKIAKLQLGSAIIIAICVIVIIVIKFIKKEI